MRMLLLIWILFTFGCHSSGDEQLMRLGDVSDNFEVAYEPISTQPLPVPQQADNKQITKKLIKTGGINFQSEDVEEDYKRIREMLPKNEAYIENEDQSKSDQRISYNITIRVPSTIYDSLFASLSALAFRLDNRYSNIEDVTERYYDLKARIKNKKALEVRYLDLLKKASEIKDILEIEKNLNEIRTEIENLQGQFDYLSKQVNFSTINLSFYEVLPYVYDSANRKGFGARTLSALDNGWQGFLSFLIGVMSLWPFILLIGGGVYLFREGRRRWKKKK